MNGHTSPRHLTLPLTLPLLSALILSFPAPTAAFSLEEAFLLNETTPVSQKFANPGNLLSTILPNLLIFAGLILFFLILGAGFTVLSSGNNPEQAAKGKQALTGAIIGFIVIIASFWIIQIIEQITGISITSGAAPNLP